MALVVRTLGRGPRTSLRSLPTVAFRRFDPCHHGSAGPPSDLRPPATNSHGIAGHLLDMVGITQDTIGWTAVVEQAATGDTVAFERIVAAYHADMIRVAFVVTGGDQDAADDAVQSAWAIAWRKLRSLRDPDRVRPWLVAVAANEARRANRQRRRGYVVEIDLATDRPAGPDPAAFADELDLAGAVHHLSPDDRSLLAMRYVAGFDSSEIGALTGRPAATVRWRLARLVGRLRKELTDA